MGMKVVILAGGQGMRIREETEFRPKPMIAIGGRPMLWHIMKIYDHHGFRDFVVCLGYKGEVIKNYFLNYELMARDVTLTLGARLPRRAGRAPRIHGPGAIERWTVTLAETGLTAMTGARLKCVQRHVGNSTFMLTYGDGVADVDLRTLLAFHRKHGKIATMTGVRPPSRFGELVTDGARVRSFTEKPAGAGGLINGGFFVFNPGIWNYLTEEDDCTLEREPLERLARDRQLMVYAHDGFWQCLDTIRDLNYLNDLWSGGRAAWRVWR